jgi:hypothetical protein
VPVSAYVVTLAVVATVALKVAPSVDQAKSIVPSAPPVPMAMTICWN